MNCRQRKTARPEFAIAAAIMPAFPVIMIPYTM